MQTGFNLRQKTARRSDDTPKTDDERLAVRRRAQLEAARGINESTMRHAGGSLWPRPLSPKRL